MIEDLKMVKKNCKLGNPVPISSGIVLYFSSKTNAFG